MSVQIETAGLDRLLSGVLEQALDDGAEAGAAHTVVLARQLVPVGPDAPHTRDTIAQHKVSEGVREIGAEEAAIVIELGTSTMPARPFLMPAALDDGTFQAFADAVRDAL
jgi:hypothetical protein